MPPSNDASRNAPLFRILAFAGIPILLTVLYFHPVWMSGKVLSANDIAYGKPPFDTIAPGGFDGAHNPLLADRFQQFDPYRSFIKQSLAGGEIPFRNPYILAGTSFAANPQSQLWYPLQWLTLPLSPASTATVIIILQTLAAGLGMGVFLARLGCGPSAAMFGATGFMFCSFQTVWQGYPLAGVTAWLPWILAGAEGLAGPRIRRSAAPLTAAALGMSLTAGHPGSILLILLLSGAYAAFRIVGNVIADKPGPAAARFGWVAAAFAVGLGLGACTLIPFSLNLVQESITYLQRRDMTANAPALPLEWLGVIAFPKLFGSPVLGNDQNLFNYNENALFIGIAPWVVLLAAVFRRTDRRTWFFAAAVVLPLAVLFEVPGVAPAFKQLPFIRHSVLMRITLWVQVGALVCAAASLHTLRSSDSLSPKRRLWMGLIAAGLAAAALAAPLRLPVREVWVPFSLAASFLAALFLWIAIAGRLRTTHAALLVAALFAELCAAHWNYNPFLDPEIAHVDAPPVVERLREMPEWFRVSSADGILEPNLSMRYSLHDVRGYDYPMSRAYIEFISEALYDGRWDYGAIYWHSGQASLKPENDRIIDLLGIRYFLSRKDGEDLLIENPDAFPQLYPASQVTPPSSDPAVDARRLKNESIWFVDTDRAGLRSTATVVRIVERKVNGMTAEVEADGDSFLVFNETALKGWTLYVNDEPRPWQIVNRFQIGFPLEPGRHEVRLRFFPDALRTGLGISLAALVSWPLLFLRRVKPRPRRKKGQRRR